MADFETAFDFMIQNEDSRREYADGPDAGGRAISGINSNSFPAEYDAIKAIPQADRGPAVELFYRNHFWNHWLDQIVSDKVAERVFDMAVNGGAGTSVKLLQMALNAVRFPAGGYVTPDGTWGPRTLSACNQAEEDELVGAFRKQRAQHYREIVAKHPAKAIYLDGWLARARK